MTAIVNTAARRLAAPAIGFAALLTAFPAHAQSFGDRTGLTATAGAAGIQTSGSIAEIAGRVIGGFIGLLGVVFVALIIYAGFLWMTAGGSDDKIKQAKKMIANAVAGLALIFAAYAIVTFVLDQVAIASGQRTGTLNLTEEERQAIIRGDAVPPSVPR